MRFGFIAAMFVRTVDTAADRGASLASPCGHGYSDAVPTQPVYVSTLPPFSNMPAQCSQCRARYEIRVYFDRACAEVYGGGHFHRICNCGHRWVERCSENPTAHAADVHV